MTLQLGDIEYEINTFQLTIGKNDDENATGVNESQKRIFVTIPKGIDKDFDQLNDEINSHFNGILIFNTRFGQLVYDNFTFEELSLEITDSLFNLTLIFIEENQ